MWTLTPDDIRRVKDELMHRRNATEARHAEELRVVEARHALGRSYRWPTVAGQLLGHHVGVFRAVGSTPHGLARPLQFQSTHEAARTRSKSVLSINLSWSTRETLARQTAGRRLQISNR